MHLLIVLTITGSNVSGLIFKFNIEIQISHLYIEHTIYPNYFSHKANDNNYFV